MSAQGETVKAETIEAEAPRAADWRRLRLVDWLALAALAMTVVIIAAPRLPPSICLADAGDLQLAATVLGIPHPPGYAGYVSLAHLFTYVPGVEPAYLVSVGCMLVGVLVVALCALTAVRLGTDIWAACALSLLLTGHNRFWQNLTTPEVYIFSIAFLTGAVYLLAGYVMTGRRWRLYVAAFLFGVAMANRPPILLAAPFFVLGWWWAKRPWQADWRSEGAALAWVVFFAILPALYNLGYLYIRDNPQTRYNYIEQHNAEAQELPDTHEGPRAKLERVLWMATAKQFHYRAGNSWKQVRAKIRWLRYELARYHLVAPLAAALAIVLGAMVAFRRCPAAVIAMAGVMAQGLVFVLAYQDFGQAADILPLLIPLTVLLGTATSVLFTGRGRRTRILLSAGLVAVAALSTVRDLPERGFHGRNVDATDFLSRLDLATFPPNSVIFSHWTDALPLLYEREIRTHRRDIDVVIAQPVNWLRMAPTFGDRPLFVVRAGRWVQDRETTPFRNIWKLILAREEVP